MARKTTQNSAITGKETEGLMVNCSDIIHSEIET